ncbi:hypothetical protein R6Q59_021896 [Mikania micrantha]
MFVSSLFSNSFFCWLLFLFEINEALRSAPLPYPEICIHLFEGSTSNGFDSWGPSSTLPHPVEEISDYNLNGLESIECTQIEPLTQGVSEESSGQSKKKEKNERLKKL